MQTLRPILAERQDRRFILVSMAAGSLQGPSKRWQAVLIPSSGYYPTPLQAWARGVTQFCTLSVTEDETQEFLRIMARPGC